MLQAILHWAKRALQGFAARRQYAAARDEFARLHPSTLRDLGMGRSEFASFWAESQGLAERTRVRAEPITKPCRERSTGPT